VVKDERAMELGTELAANIGEVLKREDGKRKDKASPFYDVYSGINAAFKPWLDRLRRAQTLAKGKCEAWFLVVRAKQRKAEEEQRRREQRAQDAGRVVTPKHIPEPIAQTTRTASGAKATMRAGWAFEVVDLKQVPRRFLMLNDRGVQLHIDMEAKTLGKPTEIKGLRIYQTASMASGQAKR
jgi:hypothetical protein